MGDIQTELISTLVLIILTFLVISITRRAIRRFGKLVEIDVNKRKVIFYLSYLIIYFLALTVLSIIWGVNLKDFVVFISSILAVLGVAFVAQWSILSNLTASVILFFSHPLRLGDRIRVLDKDFDWTGEIEDISAFYLFMKTDDGRKITIPTNLVIQKGIEILEPDGSKEKD
ncbi:mechanosensitive ion channel domain-containing protein [Lentiprolixibacter aurantiacus]|uniref:Mechanosensitive ion channel n=1 Tax=Lentiprolixibacter aurantiacus TaxID=2993939 RepID=A0AAE3SP84_9FLAO|nr:mechanosensitive ion channel domain-containing protein [Lentiprolixibacter aurantiacus]MCX2720345.1 mechanosensitive ion channel [Lentiprolixibacter aurantiacus]